MSISSLSCILVNHQPTMRKNLKEVTRKSTPVMGRTWKWTRKKKKKKKRQLCSMESLLFCAVCYQPADWELKLNQSAAKHRDWSRLGHTTFWPVLSAGGEPQGERESAWKVKLHFFFPQVNGKTYNQARLLLGAMGSLHPANRLAAYITGRVNLPAEIGKRASQKSDPAHKASTAAALPTNAAGSAAPSAKAAPTTTTVEPKTAAQLAGKWWCERRETVWQGFLLGGTRSKPLKNLPTLTPATADRWNCQMKWTSSGVKKIIWWIKLGIYRVRILAVVGSKTKSCLLALII